MNIQEAALLYAAAGYRVFPCKPGSKEPATRNGFKDASADPDEVKRMFWNLDFNLGIACGSQPNGCNLFVFDVDVKTHDGLAEWNTLVSGHELNGTPRHETPSGGFHSIFNAPAGFSATGRDVLAPGIDVRSEGGYVLGPPSRLPNGAYRAAGTWLVNHEPDPLPEWLIELLAPPQAPIRASESRHPSNGTGPSPADWVRENLDWTAYLERYGWQQGRGRRWTRPGKDVREGHSAELHDDGRLAIWTTDLPPEVVRLGREGRGGVVTISLFSFIAAYEFGGDESALGRYVRQHWMAPLLPPPGTAVVVRALDKTPAGDSTDANVGTDGWRLPVVASEYWSACARNAHIHQAARAYLVAPDALDVVVYAMQSCLIPPGFMIEPIVGGPQPLNMLGCLVARTGDFKTSTQLAALDLMGPFPPWVTAIGMGSGEGIGAMFLKEQTEPSKNGKGQVKTGHLVRNDLQAVFFEADEGSGMSQQAIRQGATMIANLCKAWSGSMLGEANADVGKRRVVLHNDYRIGALVNIQPSNFGGLFSEANTGTGLTGRFLFSGTLDAEIPDEPPPWPGQLGLPSFPTMPVTITIEEGIKAAARAAIRERHRQSGLDGDGDQVAQAPATQARMAAILALSEDRRHITADDWRVAGQRAETSSLVLQTLHAYAFSLRGDQRHKTDRARAASRLTEESEYEAIKTGQAVDRILAVLSQHGSLAPSALTDKMAPSFRDYRNAALELLESMGKVRREGKRIILIGKP